MTNYYQLQLQGRVRKENGVVLDFDQHVLEGGTHDVCLTVANIKINEWKSLKELGFISAIEFDQMVQLLHIVNK